MNTCSIEKNPVGMLKNHALVFNEFINNKAKTGFDSMLLNMFSIPFGYTTRPIRSCFIYITLHFISLSYIHLYVYFNEGTQPITIISMQRLYLMIKILF